MYKLMVKLNTYGNIIAVKALKDTTKNQFVELCDNLQNEFNTYYKTDNYSFKPEQISEGGSIFENFDGIKADAYKTMRLYFVDDRCGIEKLYELISSNVKDLWRNDSEVLIPEGPLLQGLLKSFDKAPVWCVKE